MLVDLCKWLIVICAGLVIGFGYMALLAYCFNAH